MCKHIKTGHCPFGEKCRYAHSEEELESSKVKDIISQNPLYKTKLCSFEESCCPKGGKCHFAHSKGELRVASQHHSEADEMAGADVKKENDEDVDTSQWKIVLSGLNARETNLSKKFFSYLACQGISNCVDSSVTHVVVKTGDNLEAQRTLKFLQAVSSGVRIVSFLWVEACLKDKENLKNADQWEALDEELNGANGPFRSRKSREEGKKPLLAGLEVLIDEPLVGLNKPDNEDLVMRAGGKTVSNVEMFSADADNRLVIVSDNAEYEDVFLRKMQEYSAAVVNMDWLTDTLAGHRWMPVHQYTKDYQKLEEERQKRKLAETDLENSKLEHRKLKDSAKKLKQENTALLSKLREYIPEEDNVKSDIESEPKKRNITRYGRVCKPSKKYTDDDYTYSL